MRDSIVVTNPSSIVSGQNWNHRIYTLQQETNGAWVNNIGGPPLLASESPETYGMNWWYIQTSSHAIDSGTTVVDSNGIWMRANVVGYSWNDLTYKGKSPDIGAYEYGTGGGGIVSGSVSPSIMTFGTYVIGDTTAIDSFKIKNTGTAWLSGAVSKTTGNKDFYISKHYGAYSIAPGDSMWVTIKFKPWEGGLLSCWIYTGNAVLKNVFCSGGACTITPSTIVFGNVKIGACSSTQNLVLKNTGTGLVTGTISGYSQDFILTKGTGAFSLSANASDTIGVKFCPLTKGPKIFTIHLGSYFGISDIGFTAGRSSIATYFTTTESARCYIWGKLYTPGDDTFPMHILYSGPNLHGTTHFHLISGLSSSTLYAIQIKIYNTSGEVVIYPSATTYYIVSTADPNNIGGGLIGTVIP